MLLLLLLMLLRCFPPVVCCCCFSCVPICRCWVSGSWSFVCFDIGTPGHDDDLQHEDRAYGTIVMRITKLLFSSLLLLLKIRRLASSSYDAMKYGWLAPRCSKHHINIWLYYCTLTSFQISSTYYARTSITSLSHNALLLSHPTICSPSLFCHSPHTSLSFLH